MYFYKTDNKYTFSQGPNPNLPILEGPKVVIIIKNNN